MKLPLLGRSVVDLCEQIISARSLNNTLTDLELGLAGVVDESGMGGLYPDLLYQTGDGLLNGVSGSVSHKAHLGGWKF